MLNGKEIFEQTFEINELLMCASRAYNEGACGYKKYAQPLVLGHFSDIHGDKEELERVIAVKDYLGDRMDDLICTGDLIPGRIQDGIEFWNSVDGSDKILVAMGNHDTLADPNGFNFSIVAPQKEQYDVYYKGKVEKQNIAIEENKTYYYKDYPAKAVRLIVLNVMITGNDRDEQVAWFENAVKDAKEKNLTVLCASHFLPKDFVRVECNFTDFDRSGSGANLDDRFLQIIDSFIDEGGSFVCWLAGHIHGDFFGYSKAHPNQYTLSVDALSRLYSDYYSDMPRDNGTVFQDVMNFIVVDTTSNLLHIIRIGGNLDRYLRSKRYMTFDYKSRKIICQE